VKLRPAHRARRFARSLVGGAPPPADEAWARGHLSDAEARLFSRMTPNDRRHSVAVARAVVAALGGEQALVADPDRSWVVTAALLHDVGKTVSGLGTYGRVVATLSGWVGGHDMAGAWADTRGFTRRVGLYLQYERLGAEQLAVAGSDPRVVAWAEQHHLPEEDWTVPPEDGRLLQGADDGAP
jgi:hypothetical protein